MIPTPVLISLSLWGFAFIYHILEYWRLLPPDTDWNKEKSDKRGVELWKADRFANTLYIIGLLIMLAYLVGYMVRGAS